MFVVFSILFSCLFALLSYDVSCAPLSDEVLSLPGWDAPLTSQIFSGFIDAGSSVTNGVTYNFRYWYVFIASERPSASTDPIILWSNGGPGASSAYGLFTEFGPYVFSSSSLSGSNASVAPRLFRNNQSWTTIANVLILNGGGPTGFTYCDPIGPSGDGSRCGSWDDDSTALHNSIFVQNWFKAFPEYQKNELFLIGESYAGVYMPMLFSALSSLAPIDRNFNLVGLALGDACVGTDVLCGAKTGPWYSLLFQGGHNCFSLGTFETILDETICARDKLKSGDLDGLSTECSLALAQAAAECPATSYYEYNYYDKCTEPAFLSSSTASSSANRRLGSQNEPNGFRCGGDVALAVWLNYSSVKAALNVPVDAVYFSQDNGNGFNYTSTYKNALPLLRSLALSESYRVLIYNGDSDPGISSFRAQNWTSSARDLSLGVVEKWRPWLTNTYNSDGSQGTRVGGAVVTYEGQFQYVQIKGSGHMVPLYAPDEALTMIDYWIRNEPLPKLN